MRGEYVRCKRNALLRGISYRLNVDFYFIFFERCVRALKMLFLILEYPQEIPGTICIEELME